MNKTINRTSQELDYAKGMDVFFNRASGSLTDKLANFPRFVSRQALATFLYKYEIFQKVLDVHGSILEFGVFRGGGAFSFAQLSAILEPYNYQRRIIGFDTFEGFPEVSEKDAIHGSKTGPKKGDFYTTKGFDQELAENVALFDKNRFLNHVEKISFVKGDINETLPRFLKENRHLVVSLAYFDLDIHEPTKKALQMILPMIPKGGIIAFDELNNPQWPGETEALAATLGINKFRLQKLPFEPCRSYCVIE
ncbi:MAG: class I SAM-dependent methyltransferase [Elusimicrobia bacterium]|nr:class I SAM-dependent methyltransferase [Elusimicrobiota bacterium]